MGGTRKRVSGWTLATIALLGVAVAVKVWGGGSSPQRRCGRCGGLGAGGAAARGGLLDGAAAGQRIITSRRLAIALAREGAHAPDAGSSPPPCGILPRMTTDLRPLLRLIGRHKRRYLAGALMLAVADLGQLVAIDVIKRFIDALEAGSADAADVRMYAGIVAGTGVAVLVARFGWRQMIFGSSRMIERDVRQTLYDHLQTLSPRFFLDRKVGDLMAYATNDIPSVQQAAAGGMMQFLDAVILLVGSAVAMVVTIDARLSLIALAPLLLLNPATYWLGKRMHTSYTKVQAQFGTLSDRVQENFAGIRVVKGFGREAHQSKAFATVNRRYQALFGQMLRYDVGFDPVIGVLVGMSAALGLVYGGRLVIDGRLSLGGYMAFNSYLWMLAWPMMALGMVMNHVQRATASLARIDTLMAVPPDIRDAPDAVPLPRARGDVVVRGLTFRYAPDLPAALDGIDATPGQNLLDRSAPYPQPLRSPDRP